MTTSYRQKREGPSRLSSSPCYLKPPLQPVWSLPAGGLIRDLPLIHDGRVYVKDDEGRTAARAEFGGGVGWEVDSSLSFIAGDAAVAWGPEGRVLDPKTGREIRRVRARGGSETAAVGDVVVALSFDGGDVLSAGDLSSGEALWEYKPAGPHPAVSGIFCADDRAVYAGLWDASVVALGLNDGRVVWRQSEAALRRGEGWGVEGFLLVCDDVVIARFPTNIAGMSVKDGQVVWSAPIGGTMDGHYYGGRYYTTTREGGYSILEPLTGKTVFEARSEGHASEDGAARRPQRLRSEPGIRDTPLCRDRAGPNHRLRS